MEREINQLPAIPPATTVAPPAPTLPSVDAAASPVVQPQTVVAPAPPPPPPVPVVAATNPSPHSTLSSTPPGVHGGQISGSPPSSGPSPAPAPAVQASTSPLTVQQQPASILTPPPPPPPPVVAAAPPPPQPSPVAQQQPQLTIPPPPPPQLQSQSQASAPLPQQQPSPPSHPQPSFQQQEGIPEPQSMGGGSEARVLKVEDALTYLDEVKRQFGDQPHIYNNFLEIMKSFKAETIDTPGVIQRVSELFRGHNNLILGFNTFLPPGYRIEHADLEEHGQLSMPPPPPPPPPAGMGMHMMSQGMMGGPLPPGVVFPAGAQHPMMMEHPFMMSQAGYFDPAAAQQQYLMMMGDPAVLQQQQLAAQQHGQPGQPVEFDHAISYVTRIKRRFANDADTYKAFLDILHTYQKEQKSIKEVLDQVSELFKDHPDLLKEFTYFLPDGVREKAKQEITRINNRRRKEEQRREQRTERKELKASGKAGKGEGKDKSGGGQAPSLGAQKSASPTGVAGSRRDRDVQSQQSDEPDEVEKERGVERGGVSITLGKLPRLEKRLFGRIRAALMTRERWGEFLKCLELYSQEILTRAELISLATDMFASNTELLEEFDRLLASRGATDDPTEDAWFSIPMSDIDFSQSRRATPSYRSLPPNYPKPPCSERTALCRMVLNDTWVAVPTGSEDFSFKSMRKNQYEEALFKCEDDRYELDMIIDSNQSAIHALEPLAQEIEALAKAKHALGTDGEGQKFKLDRRTLNVIHLKAIARVYGDRSAEIFELMKKSPASAIPIVLGRLKAKDDEWRKQRVKLNEGWKEMMEKNYVKSLDHRSFYFKQNEKKLLTPKTMIAEAKDSANKTIALEFPDAFGHRHAQALIAVFAEKALSKAEYDKCIPALEKVVSKLVGVKSFGGKSLSTVKVGTKVLSRYGLGTVSSAPTANSPQCEVKLLASGSVVRVSKDDLLEANPFNPKEMGASSPATEPLYIGQTAYLFLRFYQILCERLSRAEAICLTSEREQRTQVKHVVDRNGGSTGAPGKGEDEAEDKSVFGRMMHLIKQMVRGTIDANKFEDDAYTTFGTHCYFLFTLDKLLNLVVRSLQGMINEERVVKLSESISKYQEKKSAFNAAEVYRNTAEILSVGNACAAIRLKIVPGSNPYAPPHKRLADSVSDASSGDVVLASVDLLWEQPPQVVLELLDSIPQNVNFGIASGRSLSPVGFETDGSAVATEMGELEFVLPIRVDAKKPSEELTSSTKGRKSEADASLLVLSAFVTERVPGSDDVFRHINAFKNESGGSEKEWWKSSAQLERTLSPNPDDSGSSNEDVPPAGTKRLRGSEDAAE